MASWGTELWLIPIWLVGAQNSSWGFLAIMAEAMRMGSDSSKQNDMNGSHFPCGSLIHFTLMGRSVLLVCCGCSGSEAVCGNNSHAAIATFSGTPICIRKLSADGAQLFLSVDVQQNALSKRFMISAEMYNSHSWVASIFYFTLISRKCSFSFFFFLLETME